MSTENKIIHIVINDWNDEFESKEAKDLLDTLVALPGVSKDVSFNYTVTNIDYALFFLITTTKEDLEKHNLDELLNCVEKETHLQHSKRAMFTINMFPEYNPKIWNTPENGKSFDFDAATRTLFMVMDDNGYEYMMNVEPSRIEKYIETVKTYKGPEEIKETEKIYERYLEKQYRICDGWMHGTKPDECGRNFYLFNYIELPTGFIEQQIGRKPDNHTVYTATLYEPRKVKLFD